ncbi:Macroglobulin domain MG3 [Popillia japonica]|uniref:Macroglobulin domain MG3 n=1 Tax=Popillia japonica TaxID=7064 RepID=A0AAW1LSQ0_POPJA
MKYLVFLLLTITIADIVNSYENDFKYSIYFPKNMISGQPSTICAAFSDETVESVSVGFKESEYISNHKIQKAYSCFDIIVPKTYTLWCTLKIDILKDNRTINLEDSVTINPSENRLFIETDRGVYKKGDVVKIRLLVLGYDLRPLPNYQIQFVKINNPSGTVVAEWKSVVMELGLSQIEFQLAAETSVGTWIIHADGVNRPFQVEEYVLPRFKVILFSSQGTWIIHADGVNRPFQVEEYVPDGVNRPFQVEEYVLPRFKVNIVAPEFVYENAAITTFSVCAKYSYGKNVKGTAFLKINSRSKINDLTNGCAKFNFTKEELQTSDSSNLKLEASVTEKETNQVELNTKVVDKRTNPFTIVVSERIYKPGLPLVVDIKLENVNLIPPLEEDIVEVCIALDIFDKVCSNFTVLPEKNTELILPPLRNKVHLKAQSIGYPYVATTKYVQEWISDSGNFLQIKKSAHWEETTCKSSISFTVFYTSKDIQEGQSITFYYIVLSRNEIVDIGQVKDTVRKSPLHENDSSKFIGNLTDYFSMDEPVNKFNLDINLNDKIFIDSKLIVYHEFRNELIADKLDFKVKKCFPNLVSAQWGANQSYPGETTTLKIKADKQQWGANQSYPGETTTLKIKADKHSLCSISAVDEASKYMGSGSSVNIQDVFNSYDNMKNRFSYDRLNCRKLELNLGDNVGSGYIDYENPSSIDSSDIFRDAKIGVMSNLKMLVKTCDNVFTRYEYDYPRRRTWPISFGGGLQMSAFNRFNQEDSLRPSDLAFRSEEESTKSDTYEERGSKTRSYFPETWLWDLIPVGTSGSVSVDRILPDSITTWETKVMCVSQDSGVGLSEPSNVNVFKPFFIDVLLPYSIKRNSEILHLPVVISNYLSNRLDVRITLVESEGIIVIDGEKVNNKVLMVDAQDTVTQYYRIKANKIGRINITVSGSPVYSTEGSIPLNQDTVQKELLVVPEGHKEEIVKSALLCGSGDTSNDNVQWEIILPEQIVPDTAAGKIVQWEIILPEQIVPDTAAGKIIINSDILGPMFQNLENILSVPSGCGEQTMAKLTPNLYVLKYLEANNALDDKIKQRILSNFKTGYQRILNYRHRDGSFSAFGGSDSEGSMFLTAFVVRTLRQMKNYMIIDDNIINTALEWIMSHQLENGCFDPVKHVFQQMGVASSRNQTTALTAYVLISLFETHIKIRNQTTALTAYVLISLFETHIKINDQAMSKARQCLLHDITSDKYTLAISSYALSLMNEKIEAETRLKKLTQVAIGENNLIWWKQSETSQSANIEVASYVIMALLKQNTSENAGTVHGIIRWLQTKLKPSGGFYSTVDTVVGLDAISRYATLINEKGLNLNVLVEVNDYKANLHLAKRDRIKADEVLLDTFPSTIRVKVNGSSCVIVQAFATFYLQQVVTKDIFKLDVNTKSLITGNKCSMMELNPCISYTGIGESNMAILEVQMPSGYTPDEVSLHELRINKASTLKKFEQIRNEVVFYFTQLGQQQICIPFKIAEDVVVENVAKATVKLYDYYQPELSISKSFKLDCTPSNN